MKYAIDTNALRTFYRFYYRTVTPQLYINIETMMKDGILISVREVYNEIERQHKKDDTVMKEIYKIKEIFAEPESKEEIDIVKRIYQQRNFTNNVKEKNILKGRPVADAFLVAKAKCKNATIVTGEKYSPNAAKIPNMCKFLEVSCMNFEDFLVKLNEYT